MEGQPTINGYLRKKNLPKNVSVRVSACMCVSERESDEENVCKCTYLVRESESVDEANECVLYSCA